MVLAKCNKCGGSGIADTFEQAKNLINHAVGLSRGIKCGDNYNMVKEIKPKGSKTKPKTVTTKPTPKPVTTETKPLTKPTKPTPKTQTSKTIPQKTSV